MFRTANFQIPDNASAEQLEELARGLSPRDRAVMANLLLRKGGFRSDGLPKGTVSGTDAMLSGKCVFTPTGGKNRWKN